METKKGGAKITSIYIWFMIFLVIASVLLIYCSFRAEKSIGRMQEVTNEYIAGQSAINEMREASDFLTEKSRSFISTGDIEDGKMYYKEIEVDKRREKSLETMAGYEREEEIYQSLKDALDESNSLAEIECYAMRLACEGYNIDPADVSEDLAQVRLTAADRALSKSEQRIKARGMVFDNNYDTMKDDIITDVLGSLEKLLDGTHDEQVEAYEKTVALTRTEHAMIVLILICMLAMVLLTARKLIVPMMRSTGYIENNELLPTAGAREYAYLAQTYNSMLEKTMKHHEELSYEATHDELTGLYNRKMFEAKREELADTDIAMLIIDIDRFKEVNDENGHEIGDKVLKKVADILASSFRLEDSVCRIGGDEFCVMMVQMTPELKHVAKAKIDKVMDRLIVPDDLPKVTLSIGVAFSADEGEGDLFAKADKALYATKNAGRDGYTFYCDMV